MIQTHPTISFWLDIADKCIKFAAVAIGGWWTWWNYRKSRTYEQKLDLEVTGSVFVRQDLYGDVKVTVKNIGDTKHTVQKQGTLCEVFVVTDDLTEQSVGLFRAFTDNDRIEPGESISDIHFWRIPRPTDNVVWIKLHLRVVADGVEWTSTCVLRVADAIATHPNTPHKMGATR